MGVSVFPAPSAASKTMFRTTLTSGTSYTVPAGVTYLNVTLVGGGGGGSNSLYSDPQGHTGRPGAVISSTLSATAGASIAYAIGAGGAGGGSGGTGGSTTFTGATTAVGGNGSPNVNFTNNAPAGTDAGMANNAGAGGQGSGGSTGTGGTGGAGCIYVEYWA